MALHRSEQILAAIKTNLGSLTTVTAANVVRARVYDFADGVTNAISIYMGSDVPVGDGRENSEFNDHFLDVLLEVHVKNATLDTQINLIKKEIVQALMADRSQGLAFVIDTIEQGWEEPALMESETRSAKCSGRFQIWYRRSYTDPSA